jgi:hypothetical protein
VNGKWATIDLSSASDCVAESVVKIQLPPDWFELLDRTRSKFTLVNGKQVLLEKFSSMGNGFTFELETVIFLCIITGLSEDLRPGENVFVYGDDIIVPQEWAGAVLGALRWWGFMPNEAKTFVSGPFRESCGGDFFLGVDVRPYYWKEDISDPSRLISLANGLRRFQEKDYNIPRSQKDRLRKVWFGVLDRIPSHIRVCRGPETLGDIVIHDLESKWDTRVKDSIRYLRCWKPAKYAKVYLAKFHPDVIWASLLYGVETAGNSQNDESRFVVPRDGVRGYSIGWVPFS